MNFKKGSYWLTSGAYSLLERFSLQIFRFGGFYFLVRGLDKDEFGVWTIFLIIGAFIEVTRIGLVQNGLVKFLTSTDDPKARSRINTASLALNVILTFLSVIIIFSVGNLPMLKTLMPGLNKLLYIYMFTTIALIPFFQLNFLQQANYDFKGIFYANFIRYGSFFTMVVIAYFNPSYQLQLTHVAAFQGIAAAAGSLVACIMAWKYLDFSSYLDRKWLKELFHYGKFVMGTNLGSLAVKSIDQLMLGIMMSPVAVAIYGTAIKFTNLIETPTYSVASIVFPKSAYRAKNEGMEAVKRLYEKSVGVILALIIPGVIIIILFPEFMLRVVAGDRYLEAAPILQVAMLYGLFVPFARQFGATLDAMGKPKVNFYLVLFSAAFNLSLNYILITHFGVMGAVYGTLITYVLLFVINQIILYREINVSTLQTLVYAHRVYMDGFSLLRQKLTPSANRQK